MKILMPLVLCLAACGGAPFRAREKDSDRVATADATHLVCLDDQVKFSFELIDYRIQLLPDGRLKAQLRLVNHSSREQRVQMSWTFKDDRNFPTEEATPFEHHLVAGGQTLELTRHSLGAGATDFYIQLRTAKDGGS